MSQPPSNPAWARLELRTAAEQPLSTEEFQRYVEAPMTPEERENELALIRWFKRRYPTPGDRLAYSHHAAEDLLLPLELARCRRIDMNEYLGILPDLGQLEAIGESEPFTGCRFLIGWDGHWEVANAPPHLAGGLLLDAPERDVILQSTSGRLVLEGASVTHLGRSISPNEVYTAVKGVALGVRLERGGLGQGQRRFFRCYIKSERQRLDWLPCALGDFSGTWTLSWLPLRVQDTALDLLFLAQGPYFVFETRSADLDEDRFTQLVTSARLLLTYLTGESLLGDSCVVVGDAVLGEARRFRWLQGLRRERRGHPYTPIPVSWSSRCEAQETLGLPERMRDLDPAVLSRCLAKLDAQQKLGAVIDKLIECLHVSLGTMGALLAVALEGLIAVMLKSKEFKQPSLIAEERWDPTLKALLETLNRAEKEHWSEDDREKAHTRFLKGLERLNDPSNQEKLWAPFDWLEVHLRREEKEAIKDRNKLLHGWIPDLNGRDWINVHRRERQLYTAINKLLLKYLGYEGPIMDWGESPPHEVPRAFQQL